MVLGVLLGGPSWARPDAAGRVEGLARDETGKALPGVAVHVRAVQGELDRLALTDAQGRFQVAGLPSGRYRTEFRLPGFATSVRTAAVPPAGSVRIDVTLRIALSADVLVTGRRTFRSLTDLDEPVNGLIGLAGAGSEGVVAAEQLEQRPVYRVGEMLESVPGVVVSQHSGEGKANQYYVRGFNIDHGTDLATWVAGSPVNMPTHAHGQGSRTTTSSSPSWSPASSTRKGRTPPRKATSRRRERSTSTT